MFCNLPFLFKLRQISGLAPIRLIEPSFQLWLTTLPPQLLPHPHSTGMPRIYKWGTTCTGRVKGPPTSSLAAVGGTASTGGPKIRQHHMASVDGSRADSISNIEIFLMLRFLRQHWSGAVYRNEARYL